MAIKLGATYRDKVTGFEGIATGIASYITGCDQVCLSPQSHDGKVAESSWFDDLRLEEMHAAKRITLATSRRRGGPSRGAPTK